MANLRKPTGAQKTKLDKVLKATRRGMRIGDHVVPVSNAPDEYAEQIAALMLDDPIDEHLIPVTARQSIAVSLTDTHRPVFVATYHDGADGQRHFRLYSLENGANCAEIATAYGGKGSERAATFARPLGWEGD
jgi:hypothetical protein